MPTKTSRKFGTALLLGSAAVIAMIVGHEGGKLADGSSIAYADRLAGGIPTVCAGLTRHVTDTPIVVGEVWPAEKCVAEETRVLLRLQLDLEKCFVIAPPQTVFEAATSHAWNFGVGKTCGSGAMDAWKTADWTTGCRRLAFADSGRRIWSSVKTGKTLPNGKPEYRFVPGLATRRDSEYAHCISGVQD